MERNVTVRDVAQAEIDVSTLSNKKQNESTTSRYFRKSRVRVASDVNFYII
jgi:hypothetical protein